MSVNKHEIVTHIFKFLPCYGNFFDSQDFNSQDLIGK